MNRFAVLIDAGYLLSQGVQILSNQKSKYRKDLAIHDAQGLISKIVEHSASLLGNPNLLRVYWYDGVNNRLSAEQETLSLLPDVQFRQGTINKSGLQKGVDSRILVDLIELSTNQAISDAVLVTGDGDLVIGIDLAQRRGVRVAVLGVEDLAAGVHHCQSFEVVCTADRVKRLSGLDLAPFLSYTPGVLAASSKPASSAVPSSAPKKSAAKKTAATKAPASELKPKVVTKSTTTAAKKVEPNLAALPEIVRQFIVSATPPFEKTTISTTGSLGQATDSKLLKAATAGLGRNPTPSEKTELRRMFKQNLSAL